MALITEQEIIRKNKLAKYQELHVDPFGKKFKVNTTSRTIRSLSHGKSHEKLEKLQIKVAFAGRIMMIRRMGKASFITLQDKEGTIQAYIQVDNVGQKQYDLFKLADIGDIVGLQGTIMITKTGEPSIKVTKYTHLTKALKPLPEKFHGLVDVEERYRHRYVDLITNEKSKEIAFLRPKIIKTMREYFDSLDFVEVETSVLAPFVGGAAARPFITHYNALNRDFYLRIATEINLKKLIVGGMEKVYEIGRLFRNEGIDTKHNPEFTTVELYEAYADLKSMRILLEKLLKYIAKKVFNKYVFDYKDYQIDLSKPFRWVSMTDLVKEATGIDFTTIKDYETAVKLAEEHHLKVEKTHTGIGHILNEFFETYCEAKLIQPTFVYGHPVEISPLAKKNSKDPRFAERFEFYILGSEYANAYSELNDPLDQRERFEAQLAAKALGDQEANDLDEDFLEALEYGMPPTGGIGIGIDRLIMFFLKETSIREVILFPHMKEKNVPSSKTEKEDKK
ncbi:MAG: lysine--tRNA ligase [Erysipelotrichaceae bacterium]|nr:lysine--tRNA ligase [Erysipelotrichaceae bacterium]